MIFTHWPNLSFYIMSELWKVALLSVIFWGFINQNLSLEKAKRFYPSLLLGSSIGAILSGPIIVFCTSNFLWNNFSLSSQKWQHSLYFLTFFLIVIGLLILFKKIELKNAFIEKQEKKPFSRKLLSLNSSLKYLMKSPYLSALLIIVLAEYISYALGELIFLQTLKAIYPTRSEYCKDRCVNCFQRLSFDSFDSSKIPLVSSCFNYSYPYGINDFHLFLCYLLW